MVKHYNFGRGFKQCKSDPQEKKKRRNKHNDKAFDLEEAQNDQN